MWSFAPDPVLRTTKLAWVGMMRRTCAFYEPFMELLDDRFGAKARGVYYIMEGVKRETFMADPQQVLLVVDSPNP